MESISKLDYIMRTLNISGKDLAQSLGVDKTTVSKWRNNQRRLTYDSRYIRNLSEYLLNSEAEKKRQVIHSILKTYKPDVNFHSLEQQIDIFSLWLSEEKLELVQQSDVSSNKLFTPKYGYNTNVSIFLGERGIDEAIQHYMKYLLKMAPGKTMYLIDYSGINWTNGDESTDKQIRINTCMELFRPVLDYGQKFVIVDCDTDIYRPYRAIFRWMELYLMDGVEVWTHPRLYDEQYHYTTFVVKDEIALQCISNGDFPDKHHGMMYKNTETIDFMTNSALAILKKSKKLIDTIPTQDVMFFTDILEEHIKSKNQIYMMNPSLTLQCIDEDLLSEILRDNHVNEESIQECIAINRKFKRFKKKCRYISIYNLDHLELMVAKYKIFDNNLSEICRKKITISKAIWNKVIQSVMSSDVNENSPIYFTSFKYLSFIPDNLSILVQDDSFVAAWNVDKYKKRMYCVNPNVISGFYRYIDDIWHMIPRVCKDINWRNRQLERFLYNNES